MPISLRLLILSLCTLATLQMACAPKPAEEEGAESPTIYYIDAALGFAIEYPADWSRVRVESVPTVRWFPKPEKSRKSEVVVAISSLPPSEVPGGSERMLGDYVAAHPGFVLTAKDLIAFAGTTPALQVLGHTPLSTKLVLFITSSERAFVLEFSALPEDFDQFRPVFEKMADTLRVLD